MQGYLKRNSEGVKEIREGDVKPEWNLNYGMRHSMSQLCWGYYWDSKIAWEVAKIVRIHPGLYWAFPEEEGKIEYALFGGWAIPVNIAPCIIESTDKPLDMGKIHRKMERMLYEDGGYKARKNAKDGGL